MPTLLGLVGFVVQDHFFEVAWQNYASATSPQHLKLLSVPF